ncbi:MAG: transcriptional regulator [Planctomycetes bacterium]|nr:transcriptional regulator [Planctomycetota bacterium]
MSRKKTNDDAGAFAYSLDRVLHEKARLGILTALLNQPDGCLFGDLKRLCDLTDGNLSRHLQVLQADELIEIWKASGPGRPQTLVRLSNAGRKAFLGYIEELSNVVADAQQAGVRRRRADPPPGFAPA